MPPDAHMFWLDKDLYEMFNVNYRLLTPPYLLHESLKAAFEPGDNRGPFGWIRFRNRQPRLTTAGRFIMSASTAGRLMFNPIYTFPCNAWVRCISSAPRHVLNKGLTSAAPHPISMPFANAPVYCQPTPPPKQHSSMLSFRKEGLSCSANGATAGSIYAALAKPRKWPAGSRISCPGRIRSCCYPFRVRKYASIRRWVKTRDISEQAAIHSSIHQLFLGIFAPGNQSRLFP